MQMSCVNSACQRPVVTFSPTCGTSDAGSGGGNDSFQCRIVLHSDCMVSHRVTSTQPEPVSLSPCDLLRLVNVNPHADALPATPDECLECLAHGQQIAEHGDMAAFGTYSAAASYGITIRKHSLLG